MTDLLTPALLNARTKLKLDPDNKPLPPVGEVVLISSSEGEDEEPTSPQKEGIAPLIHSPVKASHVREVIDLTLSSSDDEAKSESSDGGRKAMSLLEDSPPPRLRRLIKGSRFPGVSSGGESSIGPSAAACSIPKNPTGVTGATPPLAGGAKERFIYQVPSPLAQDDSDGFESAPEMLVPCLDGNPCDRKSVKRSPQLDRELRRPTQETPLNTSPGKKRSAPRVSKKALQAAEQARREVYAQELFGELNQSVFQGRLPQTTALNWSNRLLTTAGRARWRRSVNKCIVHK